MLTDDSARVPYLPSFLVYPATATDSGFLIGRVCSNRKYWADVPPSWSSVWAVLCVLVTFRRSPMNRVLVAGIAGMAMLLTASTSYAGGFGRKCGGASSSCGGLLSNLGSRCREPRNTCGGGLLAKLQARKSSCCGVPAPSCCEPAPTCAPAPTCCEPAPVCAPAPTCCEPAPACGGCSAPVSSCGCSAPAPVMSGCSSCGSAPMMMSYDSGMVYSSGVVTAGCANCSQTMDSGMIIESSSPSMAPPAPAPVADPAADAAPAASASDAPAAPAAPEA